MNVRKLYGQEKQVLFPIARNGGRVPLGYGEERWRYGPLMACMDKGLVQIEDKPVSSSNIRVGRKKMPRTYRGTSSSYSLTRLGEFCVLNAMIPTIVRDAIWDSRQNTAKVYQTVPCAEMNTNFPIIRHETAIRFKVANEDMSLRKDVETLCLEHNLILLGHAHTFGDDLRQRMYAITVLPFDKYADAMATILFSGS